ncbi:uncharacterized protein PHALS_12423 [Plasmopara halstedii]|uniref:Uncharacterized protein n=1 Tax=Plasmopara halstedii TaxID=4781 RepID=A0A0P1AM96_PLAHL|nr:uncharacterized protein PHALS_12423 [Plasmopara halstedii]CEG42121.1 hypothetical protein PHALS_12423 [Plasmopara halstedii]|eukprot:XP_024578490.1 hypothetical protein PHALS_12423 [Plasmopara halstedii]
MLTLLVSLSVLVVEFIYGTRPGYLLFCLGGLSVVRLSLMARHKAPLGAIRINAIFAEQSRTLMDSRERIRKQIYDGHLPVALLYERWVFPLSGMAPLQGNYSWRPRHSGLGVYFFA